MGKLVCQCGQESRGGVIVRCAYHVQLEDVAPPDQLKDLPGSALRGKAIARRAAQAKWQRGLARRHTDDA